MSAGVNLGRAMERIRSKLEAGTLSRADAIAEADELMYDYVREIGLNTAMDGYREIQAWDF